MSGDNADHVDNEETPHQSSRWMLFKLLACFSLLVVLFVPIRGSALFFLSGMMAFALDMALRFFDKRGFRIIGWFAGIALCCLLLILAGTLMPRLVDVVVYAAVFYAVLILLLIGVERADSYTNKD